MGQEKLSVLVVDDSALMRNIVGKIIDGTPDLVVASKAINGAFALKKLASVHPDVIVLDLEMPEMNGIEFLKERKRLGIDIPVVILSSLARKGAAITMEAMALGASDFIPKPSGTGADELHQIEMYLVATLRGYAAQYRRKKSVAAVSGSASGPALQPAREGVGIRAVAIGISTGGPHALRLLFGAFDASFPVPVFVVQHMPAGFTREFAESLNKISALEVKEAENGDVARPGRAFIAPGDQHMTVVRERLAEIIQLNTDAPVNGHRPSADVLFPSVAQTYGAGTLAVIMTGMGKDGARTIGDVKNAGGVTIGQDEESCVVYGMPRVAAELGNLNAVVPLESIAAYINQAVSR